MAGGPSGKRGWFPWLVFAITAVGALTVAIALYRLENARHTAHFKLAASERVHWLENGTELEFRPVRQMAAVFRFQGGEISEREFRVLAESAEFLEQSELLAIQWIARGRSPSGQQAFSIRYSYSPSPETTAGDSLSGAVLERARKHRQLLLTPWYRFDGLVRVRVLRPVFRLHGGSQELLGFVSGIYRVDRLLQAVLRAEEISMDLYVTDLGAPVAGYFHRSQGAFRWVGPDLGPFPGRRQTTRNVNLFGANWSVTAVSQPGAFVASPWGPLVIGLGGVLFGAFLMSYLRMLLEREAQVRQLVALRTEELNRRTEQLQAVNAELENFAYIASHDLRAPLRAVSQLASSIEEDKAEAMDDETTRRMRLMRERIKRMDDLIEGLLIYSRAGGAIGEMRDRVSLEPLLRELSDELALPAEFRVEIQEHLPTLRGDALHLRQIFQNLITNAAAHHDHSASGTVSISARDEGRYWRLDIADNGPGIPPEDRERVFRMFASAGGRNGQVHAGIGLALARRLVHGYGGRIDVVANQPRGARFRIWWPK